MPARRPIAANDAGRVFDDACICDLARELPACVDLIKLGTSIRKAALDYAEAARALSADEVRIAVKSLYDAANFKRPSTKRTTGVKYEKVARQRERLPAEAVRLLTDRAARISRPPYRTAHPITAIGRNGEILSRKPRSAFSVALPTADELRDPLGREEALARIIMLCSSGNELYAPRVIHEERGEGGKPVRRRRPKRKAELEFVGTLRVAWLEATGTSASRTASWHQPGPFVRFATKCLQFVGAYNEPRLGQADRAAIAAAKFINEWERRRREVRKRMLLNLIGKWRFRWRREVRKRTLLKLIDKWRLRWRRKRSD